MTGFCCMNNILRQMFGMGGGGRRETGPAKGEDQQHPLKCTLEDLYNGRTRKMKLNKCACCAIVPPFLF